MIITILTVILSVALCGCASHEDMVLYYDAVKSSTVAHESSVRASDVAYINAVSALKDNPMGLLVLALTYRDDPKQVDYSAIYHPQGFVEGLSAASPIINTGLMWGIGAWGLSEVLNGAGAIYNVSGNGKIAVDSNLRDSQNENYGDTALIESGGFTSPSDPADGYAQCLARPPFGYNDNGTPLYSSGCSCNTHYNGGGC